MKFDFNKIHLQNIKGAFEEKTGVRLTDARKNKRPAIKSAVALATLAAMFFLAVFGNTWINPHNENIFVIKAYAMEQQADGSIELFEVNLPNERVGWVGALTDDNEFYLSVGLQCKGENIKSVEFTTDEGFFATLSLKTESGNPVVAITVDAGDGQLGNIFVMYGTDFEKVGDKLILVLDNFEKAGSRLILDKGTMTDDLLIFWGNKNEEGRASVRTRPENVDIRAIVTFNDGQTQEQVVTLDFSGTGVYTIENIYDDGYWEIPNDLLELDEPLFPAIKGEFAAILRQDDTLEEIYINKVALYTDTVRQNVWVVDFDVKPKPEHMAKWLAGNGEERGDWIMHKWVYIEVTVQNGALVAEIIGTEL